jgi:hypothetical protein
MKPIAATWNPDGAVKYFESDESLLAYMTKLEGGFAAANIDGIPHRITMQDGKLSFCKWAGLFNSGNKNWLPDYPKTATP